MQNIEHNGKIYYPPGGGSYFFGEDLIEYIINYTKKDFIKISIGSQPNSSPHLGTLAVFCLSFAIAKEIHFNNPLKKTLVFFEVIDTAPSKEVEINGIVYQKSLRKTTEFKKYMKQYFDILDNLKKWSGIDYEVRYQSEFNETEVTKSIVSGIIKNKEKISKLLDPKKSRLRIRIACPICNLSDKEGEKTVIQNSEIISYCPEHGKYVEKFDKSFRNFEYNTPLRNLIRGILYSNENLNNDIAYEWIRLTGSDYAGFYQEQLLYKGASQLNIKAHELPLLLYAPLITDWSGAKLSKSLYLNEGAYDYLPNYIVNYEQLIKKFGNEGLEMIFLETIEWIKKPYKLFRNYSVYYFMDLLENNSKCVK